MRLWLCSSWLLAFAISGAAARVEAQSADPWLGRDKLLHFSVELGVTGVSYAAAVPLLEQPWQRALFAAGVGLSLGAGKELYDASGRGDPSLRDFAWDLIGCAVGVGLALLIDLALRDGEPKSARARPAPWQFRF